MTEVQSGSANIDIVANDKTAPAFKAVNANFEEFGKSISNLENNLKPLQEIFKGGITIGGIATGTSVAIQNVNLLKDSVLNTNEAINKFGQVIDNDIFTKISSGFTMFNVAVVGSISACKQLAISWRACMVIGKTFSAAIYAQAIAKKMSTVSTIANTNAEVSNTASKTANATATAGATVTLKLWDWACATATVATNSLTAALGMNPFTAWAVAITAAITAIVAIGYTIYSFCKSSENRYQSLKDEGEQAGKTAEAYKKLNESLNEENNTDMIKVQRLQQLQKKNEKNGLEKMEKEEYDKLKKELSSKYGKTFLFKEIAQEHYDIVKRENAKKQIENLKNELKSLKEQNTNSTTDEDKKESNTKRIQQIQTELEYYQSGGIENITGKSVDDILKLKIEATQKEIDQYESVDTFMEEMDKKRKKVLKDNVQFRESIENRVIKNNENAMQKEIDAMKQAIDKRREELAIHKEKAEILQKDYDTELKKLEKLEKIQKKLIEDKYTLQADQFYTEQQKKVNKEISEKASKEEEKTLNASIDNNPLEALKTIQERLTTANSEFDKADSAWKSEVSKATADGFLSEDEKKRIDALEQARAEAMTRVEKMQGFKDTAKGKVQERIDEAVARAKKAQEVNPVATLIRGSVEAYKQEIENANRGKTQNPAVAKIDEVKKQLENEAKEKTELQKRNNAFMEKLCKSVGAV